MDLIAIKEAVEAAMKDGAGEDMEGIILTAANRLPADASDFDRGMAAGFAAALLLKLSPEE